MKNNISNTKPLVSIVIPAYNAAKYLNEAIDSVLSQSYKNIELIVLDDGSTDETTQVLHSYPTGLFYLDRHENIGQSATLNKGWNLSKGEILSYLSADDTLMPDAVSRAVYELTLNPSIVMVYGDYELIDESSFSIKKILAPEFSYSKMLEEIIVQPGPGVFFRKACFEEIGGWDICLKQIPDFEYWLRLGLQGDFLRIPECIARYRVHETSQSFKPSTYQESDEIIDVMISYYNNTFLPNEIVSLRNRSMSMAFMISSRSHLRAERFNKFFHRVSTAIRYYPLIIFRPRAISLILNAIKYLMIKINPLR